MFHIVEIISRRSDSRSCTNNQSEHKILLINRGQITILVCQSLSLSRSGRKDIGMSNLLTRIDTHKSTTKAERAISKAYQP